MDWPSVADVAKRGGVTTEWVRQLILQGRLAAVRTRLGYLVNPRSVDKWVAEREARQ